MMLPIEAELKRCFLEFWRTWSERDSRIIERAQKQLRADVSGFGTGLLERYPDRATMMAFLKQGVQEMPKAFTIEWHWVNARLLGPTVGVVEGEATVTLPAGEDESVFFHGRASQVLVLEEGGWRIVHTHGSIPASEQAEGEVMPIDALRARNQELERLVAGRTAEIEAARRDAEIEAALERVRSRTMAMQSSDELTEVSLLLDQEVRALGTKTWGCAFNIYGEDASTEWFGSEAGVNHPYPTPRADFFLRFYELGQQGKTFHVEAFEGDACAAHYDYMLSLPVLGDMLAGIRAAGHPFPSSQVDHVAYFRYGYLLFITLEPAPEAHDIFRRFAKVFEQTYTRYLDLQKAEEQTREARIEAALERVRSRALAMSSSDELLDVSFTIRREFAGLGLDCGAFWHTRYTPEVYQKALTSIDGEKLAAVMELPRDFASNPALAAWEHGDEPIGVFQFDAEAGAEYMHHMATKGTFAEIDPEAITVEMVREHGGITFVQARTSHGEIGYSLWGEAEPTEEAKDVLVRFAGAFDLAYRRFLDLHQAEADHHALLEEKALTEQALDDLRRTQAQLIQQEKLASLGQLTAGIAHEIKNPLNFVTNFADVSAELADEIAEALDRGDDLASLLAELKQTTRVIGQHGRRADAIVKSMMQHARASSSEREMVDLNKLVAEHATLAHHGRRARTPGSKVTLVEDYDDDVGTVTVQPQELGRVVVNLVTNAFDALAEHERATPSKGDGEPFVPRVTVSTERAGDTVTIRVADNGPGIPDEIRAKIFEPFFTTKPTGSGTGLGLSMSYDIVTQGHGGTLNVEDAPDGGAVFIVRLPAPDPLPPPLPAQP